MSVVAAPSLAQETARATETEGAQLEEIIVQARRRAESIQDTPVAVSAINRAMLEQRFANTLADLQGVAPNVVLDAGGAFGQAAYFAIRGISYQDVESSFDPAIGVTIDGVFIGRNIGSLTDFFDIEQVEILRGPQGTLFGRNTIGGTINVRTARPSGLEAYKAIVTYGNEGTLNLRASADLPLIDGKLAARISALSLSSDGFWRNEFTPQPTDASFTDVTAVRASLRYTPTADWTIDLIVDHTSDRSGTQGFIPAHSTTPLSCSPALSAADCAIAQQAIPQAQQSVFAALALGAGVPIAEVDRFTSGLNPYVTKPDGQFRQNIESSGAVLDVTWDTDIGTLRSITGWRRFEADPVYDFDALPVRLYDVGRPETQDQFSQEFQINTDFGLPAFNLIAGLYFFRQEYEIEATAGGMLIGLPTATVITNITGQTSKSYAVYAEGTYNFTDAFSATLGGRVTRDEKDFHTTILFASGDYGGVRCVAADMVGFTRCEADYDSTETTPRAILQYKFTDDLNVYGSYSKGYKAGGFSGRGQTPTSIGPFKPEKVDAYEIGIKSSWFERRLRANLTGFYNKYDGLQVDIVQPEPLSPTGTETIVTNAASAETRGVELEVSANATDSLSFNVAVGYLDAEYKEFGQAILVDGMPVLRPDGTAIVEDLSHFDMRRAPKWSYSIGGAYSAPIAANLLGAIRLDYRHTSETFTTVRNQPYGRRGSLGLLDGSISVSGSDERYTLALYGKNLTDEKYINSAQPIGEGSLTWEGSLGGFAFYAPRREYGVELTAKF
ncbi:hypothetical protein ACG33_10780 [Steroidobacter denitrificans]|uniref:TonB-dependent receptor n=2 Tax=Steroidobacter denitrificans TaxID=465721 RepID=A0A127FAX8_STEDE|nr:hypothetical protein ACG33_10780 [Steroidobacter denitrificans]